MNLMTTHVYKATVFIYIIIGFVGYFLQIQVLLSMYYNHVCTIYVHMYVAMYMYYLQTLIICDDL